MEITTRFDIDDVVWRAQRIPVQVWHKCAFCVGRGKVEGADGTLQECPKCRGLCGTSPYLDIDPWCVSELLTVASVQAQRYSKRIDRADDECYMMHETGCPSGSMYELSTVQLFGTEQEAMDYVNQENAARVEPDGIVVCDCGGVNKCPKCHGYGRYMKTEEAD